MALKHWIPLLAGSPHKIIIYSNHLNLQYWRSPQKISQQVAREVLELSKYDFEICHVPGRLNGRADALSRQPNYDQGEGDNTNLVVLPNQVFVRGMRAAKTQTMQQVILQEEMEPANPVYEQDKGMLKPWVDAHNLKKVEGTWYKDGRCIVTRGVQHK